MIDNLKFNGATPYFTDFELFAWRSKVDLSGVPSPNEIKNKNKLDTIPRTVRINEFTDASLRILAEECEMSMNELINTIFNGYVNKYQEQIGGSIIMKECVLNNYLERIETELTPLKLESERKKWVRTLKNEDEYADSLRVCRTYNNLSIVRPSAEIDTAHYTSLIDVGAPWREEDLIHRDPKKTQIEYLLYIPEKKWFTAMGVLSRYFAKCDTLDICRKMEDEPMKKLVSVINNSKTDKTIVKNLTKALRHSNKIMGEEKGSIWGIHF